MKKENHEPKKAFDLLNASAITAECVRMVHAERGTKMFAIVDKAIMEYMQKNHPQTLKKIKEARASVELSAQH